jgi:hypothetical protein
MHKRRTGGRWQSQGLHQRLLQAKNPRFAQRPWGVLDISTPQARSSRRVKTKPRGKKDLSLRGPQLRSDLHDDIRPRPLSRIEVKHDCIGLIEVTGAMQKRMKLQARHIRAPCERRQIVNADITDRPAGCLAWHVRRVNPGRPEFGRIFLIESLACDAVWKPFHRDGPL